MLAEPKVYKKRPHRKVKSGCTTCKRRKIKCDEEKPACANCVRYAAECIYPPQEPSRDSSATSSITPPICKTPETTSDVQFSCPNPNSSPDLALTDLHLLHQWTISTCFGFGDSFPDLDKPWQVDVPQMGQHYPFLMRGILAVSSLHTARMASDNITKRAYVQLAAYHQDLALPEYRATVNNITKHNIAAVAAFSALATVYSFAAPQPLGKHFSGGVPDWVFLHRGVGILPQQWQGWLDEGPMRDQMHRRRLPPVDVTLNPEDYRLAALRTILANVPTEEQAETVHYEKALDCLRQAFALTYSEESRIGPKYAALLWIERVDQGYIELLNLQRPRAFVLLAHCIILFKRADHFWYLGGFAQLVLSEMKPYLSDEFLPWISWPLEECGTT